VDAPLSRGRIEILLKDGSRFEDQLSVANAHPLGAKPFTRADYIEKFQRLAGPIISPQEMSRFLSAAPRLPNLAGGELHQLHVSLPEDRLLKGLPGIF